MALRSVFAIGITIVLLQTAARGGDDVVSAPAPRVQTEQVAHQGDAADDPAIWVHPGDPASSLLLGTDKKGGLLVYDLEGRLRQTVSPGSRPNNVDVLYGFFLGGRLVDLAVAGAREASGYGMKIWTIDPAARSLAELGKGPTFAVFGGGEPYGSCVYTSPKTKRSYVVVTDKEGAIEQYQVEGQSEGRISATKVRTFSVGSQCEGCVADQETGSLYIGEEDVGIWRYGAEPDSGDGRTLVARVGDHGLAADIEGLTVYYGSGGRGYLIASSQGAGKFFVYERSGRNAYVLTIDPVAGNGISDVGETDGIDVVNVPTSPRFPRGLFVVQDGKNPGGRQNFKLYAWDDIAGSRLIVDPTYRVRSGTASSPAR